MQEVALKKEDGSTAYAWVQINSTKDKQGKSNGFTCSARDITKQKEAENALEERMEELSKINNIMVGRENRMAELKAEMKRLEKKLEKCDK